MYAIGCEQTEGAQIYSEQNNTTRQRFEFEVLRVLTLSTSKTVQI